MLKNETKIQSIINVTKLQFSAEDMILFGHFIRDNYYGAGTSDLIPYHPEKYPRGNIEKIFEIWCLEYNIKEITTSHTHL